MSPDVEDVEIELTWDPPWTPDRMPTSYDHDEGELRKHLGAAVLEGKAVILFDNVHAPATAPLDSASLSLALPSGSPPTK